MKYRSERPLSCRSLQVFMKWLLKGGIAWSSGNCLREVTIASYMIRQMFLY